MSGIVVQAQDVDWLGDDAITQIDEYGPRAIKHRNLLRAVLLLLSNSHAWDPRLKAQWTAFTGDEEISGRALCSAIRAAGISIEELLR